MALKEEYFNLNELKADVLHEMREVLNEKGWVKGALYNEDGNVCFMGAYNSVFFGEANPFRHSYRDALKTLPRQRKYVYESLLKECREHLSKLYPLSNGDNITVPEYAWPIERWNDSQERTFEEVEKAIMQMADYYETRYLEGLQS